MAKHPEGAGEQASGSSLTEVEWLISKLPHRRKRHEDGRYGHILAKAPGVSPVRVAMEDAAAESSTTPLQEGKGIVRVR